MTSETTYQVAITPENSPFQTNQITFLPRATADNNLFAEGRLHQSLFVVEGEVIKIEFFAVNDKAGDVQQNHQGNIRLRLVGMAGPEDVIIREQRPGKAAFPTKPAVIQDPIPVVAARSKTVSIPKSDPNMAMAVMGFVALVALTSHQ